MRSYEYEQERVAKDPEDYVRRLNAAFRKYRENAHAEVVSVNGETKTGMKRYTVRITRTEEAK